MTNTDPLLLPLADNGGPTPTHALHHDSSAIDAVPVADCTDAYGNPLTIDQRGVARPQGAACDIGAYERNVLVVEIDIKPGGFPNSINPQNRGVVPVAILGSDSFDVADVDVTTLSFGPGGAAPAHNLTDSFTHNDHMQDVNLDGYMDLVCHFRTGQTGISFGDETATLTGETISGQAFEGFDSIRTVGFRSRRGRVQRRLRNAEEPE